MRAHGQKDGIETARLFGLQHVVHLGVVLNANTQIDDALHLGIKHRARQAVLRNAKAHHAARQRPGLDHGDRMAQPCQLVGRRQARRPGADHHYFFAGTGRRLRQLPALGDGFITQKVFDRVDADRQIELAPVT